MSRTSKQTSRVKGRFGVAVSTTGDEHRLDLLRRCVDGWLDQMPHGSIVVVTVDGDEAATERAYRALTPGRYWVALRVGQPNHRGGRTPVVDGRQGVAVNKNTGIEFLMEAGVEHLFLSDDDTWPLYPTAITLHAGHKGLDHSMVCWGQSRLTKVSETWSAAVWKWPRGVMLYTHRSVIEVVGGMVEEFGPGGHEHVEWSQRIFNARFTPAPFVSPVSYAGHSPLGRAMGASRLWHAEDMPRPGESRQTAYARKTGHTSVRTKAEDWDHINAVMERQRGSDRFVSYRAVDNGRSSATLYTTSRGAE